MMARAATAFGFLRDCSSRSSVLLIDPKEGGFRDLRVALDPLELYRKGSQTLCSGQRLGRDLLWILDGELVLDISPKGFVDVPTCVLSRRNLFSRNYALEEVARD